MRRLTDAERALWQEAMRQTRRLREKTSVNPTRKAAVNTPPIAAQPAIRQPATSESLLKTATTNRLLSSPALPLDDTARLAQSFDQKTAARVKRGRITFDARLDLHGMTQSEAHQALLHFMNACVATRKRVLLIITGKGRTNTNAAPQGILRILLPRWLEQSAAAGTILAVTKAAPQHGGSGAYYVLLKRSRKD